MDHAHHGHHDHGKAPAHEHDRHVGHHTADFLKKFWIALALSVPIFFYSEMAMMLFGIRGNEFFGWQYVMLAFGSVVYFYCGWVFLMSAYRELEARLPGMMTLIAIAITAAYVYSAFSVLSGGMHELLFELSSLITIMLLGHWIEMRSVQGAQGALKELSKLLPDTAEVIRDHQAKLIPLSELHAGDIVVVKPGGKVPADGTVIDGSSDVNESILTGESKLVPKSGDSSVIAGSINGDGALKVRVNMIGEKTFLAGVMRLVAEAQASKSRLQMLSDRAAFYLTIIAIASGAITFAAWLYADAGIMVATERLVAVLVITCPHALGLAVPLVAAISTTMAARNGLLVRQRIALEGARTIDTVLFDKTGTLTKGEFGVEKVVHVEGVSAEHVLWLAGSVNKDSEHSIGRALSAKTNQRTIELGIVRNFERIPGIGARASVNGKSVAAGNEKLLTDMGIEMPESYQKAVLRLMQEGKTVIHAVEEGKLAGAVALGDMIRPESREAVNSLKALGISVAMITGDSEATAAWISKELGIETFFARILPHEKAEKVKLLQSQGRKVAMVGDGVNDAPALTQADLGIAIGGGTNVAIESAAIILVRNDPRDIVKIFKLSKLTYSKMIQNLWWASGYNIVAIPLAAGALASYGIILEPAFAAILMSASTVIVALNAVLLRRKSLG